VTNFMTPAQKSCHEKIAPWIKEFFEQAFVPEPSEPLFVVPLGSAAAMIEVLPWGDNDSMIRTWSYVVTGVELSSLLLHFLLRQNVAMSFGAFGIDDDGDIRFEHALVGSTCDPNELCASVMAVLRAADHYDDEIVERWGGKRAVDRHLVAID